MRWWYALSLSMPSWMMLENGSPQLSCRPCHIVTIASNEGMALHNVGVFSAESFCWKASGTFWACLRIVTPEEDCRSPVKSHAQWQVHPTVPVKADIFVNHQILVRRKRYQEAMTHINEGCYLVNLIPYLLEKQCSLNHIQSRWPACVDISKELEIKPMVFGDLRKVLTA